MKQSKTTRAMALMLSLVMITSVFVGNTLSRYVTSVSSTDNARVAVWGINGEEVTMELFKTEYDLDGKKIAAANQNEDGTYDKIIAPGTGGQSAFSIINFDQNIPPEVAYEVRIDLDDSAIDERILSNPSIQWKLDNNSWGTFDQLKTSILSLAGDPSGIYTYAPGQFAIAFNNSIDHTISWQWIIDDDNNIMDTNLGNDALDGDISAKITVKITAEQSDGFSANMLDGANQVININDVQPAVFRSAAPMADLQEVRVNDEIVDPENYTVEEGSTIIKFAVDFLRTLLKGTYKIDIVSKNMTATARFFVADAPVLHNNIIPKGGTYYVNATKSNYSSSNDATEIGDYSIATATYVAGDEFPVPQIGDTYVYGDFEYRYGYEFWNMWKWLKTEGEIDGWSVRLIDKNNTSPGGILTSIAGLDVTNFHCAFSMSKITDVPTIPETANKMTLAFFNCEELIISPIIPKSVIDWDRMFYGCSSLVEISYIPDTVISLYSAFAECDALEKVSVISDSVINMNMAFFNCSSLETIPNFPSKVEDLSSTFYGCGSLESVPEIPETVTTLYYTFYECYNLKKAPVIHENIKNLMYTFYSCRDLKGTVEVNVVDSVFYDKTFKGSNVSWFIGSISDELKQKIVDDSGIALIDPSTVSTTLSENSWDTISKVTKSGQAADYWKVGDKTTVEINGEDYEVAIADFNHDGYRTITFVFTESLGEHYMNSNNSNSGSWINSEMRKTVMSDVLNEMENKDYIKSVSKKTIKGYTDGKNDNSIYSLKYPSDKLFLLSYEEVFGNQYDADWENFNEGTQYEYFKNPENRIIPAFKSNNATWWWLRTPDVDYGDRFYVVYFDGSFDSNNASNNTVSVVPAFVIG